MIIFDLDGTLADCEHRRKHIMGGKNPDYFWQKFNYNTGEMAEWVHRETKKRFVPKWDKFYDECDKDEPIRPVIKIFNNLLLSGEKVQVWSGRSEVVREKTEKWLAEHTVYSSKYPFEIKMRPERDSTPDEQLKEAWLDHYLTHLWPRLPPPDAENQEKVYYRKDAIEFVFDDRHKVVQMWRRRGIFVFNCNQTDEAF